MRRLCIPTEADIRSWQEVRFLCVPPDTFPAKAVPPPAYKATPHAKRSAWYDRAYNRFYLSIQSPRLSNTGFRSLIIPQKSFFVNAKCFPFEENLSLIFSKSEIFLHFYQYFSLLSGEKNEKKRFLSSFSTKHSCFD